MAAARIPVNVRLTQDTIDRIDTIGDSRTTGEVLVTRTDIVREALADYFAKVTRACTRDHARVAERCLSCGKPAGPR